MKIKEFFRKAVEKLDLRSKKSGIIFAAAVVTILVLSCVAVLAQNDFNIKAAVGGDIETTTVTETETAVNLEKSNDYYLIYCTDSDSENIEFLWVARLIMPKAVLKVYTPEIDDIVEYNGTMITIRELYSMCRETEFVSALENTWGIDFTSYIGSTPETFKQMVNYFGSISIELEEPIEYRGSFNLILMKGSNALKGELLYKYVVYTGFGDGMTPEDSGDVLVKILEAAFTPGNASKADTIFTRIVNNFATDITVMTYSADSEKLDYLFENGFSSATAVESIDDLTKGK